MHKNPSSNCPSCAEKFLGCEARIVSFVRRIQEPFPDCHVAVGFRDQADQHLAYIAGKSTFDWPESKHNCTLYDHPYSTAVDLFMLGPDGRAHFLTNYYKAVWDWYLANEAQFDPDKFRWGGTFEHLKDFDHFEVIG